MMSIAFGEFVVVELSNKKAAQYKKAMDAFQFAREMDWDEWEWYEMDEAWQNAYDLWEQFCS